MKIKKLKISSSPNSRNLKILAIGDTHGDLKRVKQIPVKDIDLILLNGDMGSSDLMRRMHFANVERQKQGLAKIVYSPKQRKAAFMESYSSTIDIIKYLSKFSLIYVIFGNVENSNSDTREMAREIGVKLPFLYNSLKNMHGVRIINNTVANFRGLRIGGLEYFTDVSWIKEFKPSNYQENLRAAQEQNKKTKRILKNFGKVDILLCHQPPYGILDKVGSKSAPKSWQGKHAGSKIIRDYVLKRYPSYVFCGHIHEAKGMKRLGRTEVYNLGVCGYKIIEFPDN